MFTDEFTFDSKVETFVNVDPIIIIINKLL